MANKTLTSLIGGTALLASALNAKSDILIMAGNGNGTSFPDPNIQHVVGAAEGYDGLYDSTYAYGSGSRINFYSVVPSSPTGKLIMDSRPFDSFSTVNLKIVGESLDSVTPASVTPSFITNNNAFANKNIFADVYNITNGVRANLIRTDNLKQMASTNGSITGLTITNGHCYDFDVRFVPNPIPRPTLTSLVSNGDGTVNLGITNTYEGVNYCVESSSDLMSWQNATSNLNLSYHSAVVSNVPVPQVIIDTNSTNQSPTFGNSPSGFYRVKVE